MKTNTFLSFVMLQGIINAIVPTNTKEPPALGINNPALNFYFKMKMLLNLSSSNFFKSEKYYELGKLFIK